MEELHLELFSETLLITELFNSLEYLGLYILVWNFALGVKLKSSCIEKDFLSSKFKFF